MAKNELTNPLIGVAFDGTGFGPEGAVWGGEFLTADYRQSRRAGHLRYVGLPGGERAVREPFGMALAHLADAGVEGGPLPGPIPAGDRRVLRAMLEQGLNSPLTSSTGRLFDAVATLAGVRDRMSYEGQAAVELEGSCAAVRVAVALVSYEGQAAVELEGLATETPAEGSYLFEITAETGESNSLTERADYALSKSCPKRGRRCRPPGRHGGQPLPNQTRCLVRAALRGGPPPADRRVGPERISTERADYCSGRTSFAVGSRPLIRAVAADTGAGTTPRAIARRFHTTLAEMVAAVCDKVRAETELGAVVLSGGVFVNALLTTETRPRLRAAGFRVYRHRLVPPGDGGLALGQLAVAAHLMQRVGWEPTPEPSSCASVSPAG